MSVPQTDLSVAAPQQKVSVLAKMARAYDMEPTVFLNTIKATVMPSGGKDVSNEQVAAFLSVASQYGLNPFTREIYAFPAKGGGIQQIVSIDGWLKLINNHPQFDGMEFIDSMNDNGALVSVTCKIFRKDRAHSVQATEYLSECSRGTDPWKQWPRRMLRHKAAIQAARYAFSFSGIVDPDEAERVFDTVPQTVQTATVVTEGMTRTQKLIEAAKANQKPPIDAEPVVVEPEQPVEAVEAAEVPVAEAAAQDDLGDPNNWNA